MKINETELKRFFREYIADRLPDSRKDCPQIGDLISFFDAKSSRRLKKRILDHVAKCALCTREFEFALEVRRYETKLADHIRQVRSAEAKKYYKSNKSAYFPGRAVQLALFFVGGIITILTLNIFFQNLDGVIERGEAGSSIELIQPIQVVHEIPLLFKWNKVNDADYYVLELFSESLNPIWKSGHLSVPEISIPPEISSQLKNDVRYFWMITVYKKTGIRLESSMEYFLITE